MKRTNDSLLIKILSVICILSVTAAAVFLIFGKRQIKEEFVPPPFDSSAITGTPEVQEKGNWQSLDTDAFSVSVYTDVYISDNYAEIMLHNPSDNSCLLMLRMLDGDKNIIAHTGLIRPDEYISRVKLSADCFSEDAAVLKIMAYEPDTYYSAGAVSVNADIFV